ncbi:heme transporter CcmA [Actinobacillus pleuropneumoniae]|uniref:heme transporter CcmA n=1 Tax=Actinobacillus pleuropneumoniae TaxID=715 RepID=UPI001F228ED6|nr:heme transporter CcmA [Actinobacillus pleuropneumoniae]UKH16478.1 heme transporter CcmA [Actinobacillus pleuropneumoniae]
MGSLFIGNNPNAKQVKGLGFSEAHSEANQNINNLKYIYELKNNGHKEEKWIKTEKIIQGIYPADFNRKFNASEEK